MRNLVTGKHRRFVLVVLCAVTVMVATGVARAYDVQETLTMPPNNLGLVGWWTFDGPTINGTTVADVSGQGDNGTMVNGPTPVPGVEGQALSLNGSSQYVNCGTNDLAFNFASTSSFTESVWAYPTRVNGSWQAVFQVGRNLGLGNYQGIWLSSGNQWVFGSTGGGNLGTVNATPDKWVNITVVHTATSKAIYINGVLNATGSGDYINGDQGGALCGIGSWGGEYFAGSVDDMRVYNRALSPYEIKQLYNAGTATHQNATINPPNLQNGLVGHWTFDGPTISGTTVTDVSGNGNNGTMVNSPTPVPGVEGQALSFNGTSQYIDIPSSASLNGIGAAISMCAWVKPAAVQDGVIVARNAPGYEEWEIRMDRGGNGLFNVAISSSLALTHLDSVTTVASRVGKWTNVCGTWDGQTVRIYVNGVVENSTANTGGAWQTNLSGLPVGIGDDPTNGGPYMNGSVDDVRIYNRALSAAEVQQLYNLGTASHQNATINPPNLQSGLVGHWTFDGPTISGTTVKDVSGNGNNGTMVNDPTPVAGVLGQALSFNGTNQYVSVPTNTGIPISNNNYTISLWFREPSIGAVRQGFVGWGDYGQNNEVNAFRTANSADCPSTGGAGLVNYWWANDLTVCSGRVTANVWHYAVAEYDGTTRTIYLDGVPIGSDAPIGHNVPYSTNFTIGVDYGGDYNNGSIDDVRIYNRALSAAEVQQLYNLGR